LYSRFGGHNGGVVKGEKRKRTSSEEFNSPGQLRRFPGQPKGSLRVATGVRYNYYAQLAVRLDWMRVANLKFCSARQRG
jgi:hypothetical protein